ncbi:MAG: hypothetical protein NTW52_12715 [Planctomycetota bacterium]|nr:hypothetical protein [Planctomycetota bacterium]
MRKRVLVVTVDGWGTNLLGTYGVPICETPALDQLAAHAIVFDRFIGNSMNLLAILQSMTDGLHPSLTNERADCEIADLHQWISATNRRSVFITDSRSVSETAWADQFSESLLIDTTLQGAELSEEDGPAQNEFEEHQTVEQESDDDAWMETGLAQFVGEALSELAERQNDNEGLPDLIWLHLSGLTSAWDAPYEYRLALCDEDDPRPSFATEPVSFQVGPKTDLDEVFQAMCAAAGQARLIDHLWSWIDAFVEQSPERETMAIVLCGLRGYPLGEHTSVGLANDSQSSGASIAFNTPHSELVHVPLIIQPGYLSLGFRSRRLTQPNSIRFFFEEWLSDSSDQNPTIESRSESANTDFNRYTLFVESTQHDNSGWIQSSRCEAMYTTFWAAIFDPNSGQLSELYLMPDDRWQQNNVQNRVPEIVDAMMDLRRQWLQWTTDSIAQATTVLPHPTSTNCLNQSV